ncbi:hypothetical protein GCM10017044_08560 [Kordiimonas sediminis]|uniref:SH3b domain-containing protein n=1 Tax=Kordiimonas sediminis TaxID=1735581 RepID=A0A919E5N9_9PROT|nr:SH3 domain-containing protein [Kordiimonas sediminis]GHF16545.1 hypothetical protein GCM10017044_08560 [Kordiimonas sediminis]
MLKSLTTIFTLLLFSSSGLLAQEIGASGNPIPRFVSLKAEKAYMRTGPGRQFPIEWTYKRSGLPLEVVGENGPWRNVRDHEGSTGWMHLRLLSSARTAMIRGGAARLYADPNPTERVTILADEGVIGDILECEANWCELEIAGEHGWIQRGRLWGVYPGEVID